MKLPFLKPATTHAQQIAKLQQRGMVISNPQAAEQLLQHIQYYRLSAYWLPFESNHQTHTFNAGTTLEQVVQLYQFDRHLRLLLLDAIERIEVSIKSQWAYQLAHHHNPHAHLDASIASSQSFYQKNLDKLTEEVERSDETFMTHLLNTYQEPLPAIWAICEVMSLGLLSRWYNNLKPLKTRNAIAILYLLDEETMQSWLHHLSHVRNSCAHHSRLWNREFTITPKMPKNKPYGLKTQLNRGSRHIYNSLVIVLHFMDVIEPQNHWRKRLLDLLSQHPKILLQNMGFPAQWQQFDMWQKGQNP